MRTVSTPDQLSHDQEIGHDDRRRVSAAGHYLMWGYLAAIQSVLDRSLRLAAKVPRCFSSRLLRRGLGVRSLDDTFRRLARKFYARAARFPDNPLVTGLGRYRIRPGDSWKRPRCILR